MIINLIIPANDNNNIVTTIIMMITIMIICKSDKLSDVGI